MIIDDFFANDRRAYKATFYSGRQAEASHEVERYWVKMSPANEGHLFLANNKIKPCGLRQDEDILYLPAWDHAGRLTTMQAIFEDGTKRFYPDGKIIGSSYRIGDVRPNEHILFFEDFESAATVHMATQATVVVVMTSWNFMPVVKSYQHNLKANLMVMADWTNPHSKRVEAKNGAYQVIERMGCKLASPEFNSEMREKNKDFRWVLRNWNDLLRIAGLEEVKRQLFAMPDVKWPSPETLKKIELEEKKRWLAQSASIEKYLNHKSAI